MKTRLLQAFFFLFVLISFGPLQAAPWIFTMADSVCVSQSSIRLADLSKDPVPAAVANLCVGYSNTPGCSVTVSRKSVLRQLVSAGQAGGISFRGARQCQVWRTGKPINLHALRPAIRSALQPLVPAAKEGAPNSWFELQLPEKIQAVQNENYEVQLAGFPQLEPGRNHLSVVLKGNSEELDFPITVVLHQFNETAKAKVRIRRGDALVPEIFDWSWIDLAAGKQKTDFYGREALLGVSSARTIQAGQFLRQNDLKPTPVVFSGDPVQLQLQRGAVVVTVTATARQEGSIGQIIPVRNEITKRLVNAKIVAPGLVKWRN